MGYKRPMMWYVRQAVIEEGFRREQAETESMVGPEARNEISREQVSRSPQDGMSSNTPRQRPARGPQSVCGEPLGAKEGDTHGASPRTPPLGGEQVRRSSASAGEVPPVVRSSTLVAARTGRR